MIISYPNKRFVALVGIWLAVSIQTNEHFECLSYSWLYWVVRVCDRLQSKKHRHQRVPDSDNCH